MIKGIYVRFFLSCKQYNKKQQQKHSILLTLMISPKSKQRQLYYSVIEWYSYNRPSGGSCKDDRSEPQGQHLHCEPPRQQTAKLRPACKQAESDVSDMPDVNFYPTKVAAKFPKFHLLEKRRRVREVEAESAVSRAQTRWCSPPLLGFQVNRSPPPLPAHFSSDLLFAGKCQAKQLLLKVHLQCSFRP